MKTTLNIHDERLIEAKAAAARQQLTLTRLIEEGLRMRIRAGGALAARRRRAMPVFRGRGGAIGATGLGAGLSSLSTCEMLDLADDHLKERQLLPAAADVGFPPVGA